jgi:hypothetical protein
MWKAEILNVTRQLDSETCAEAGVRRDQLPRWIKVSAVAAASAVAGGLAAAWFYRKTLETLQNAEDFSPNPEFRISEEDSVDTR